MSYLINKEVLYYHFAELEEKAFEQVEKLSHDVDVTDWRIWSAILAERTAYKHDVFDAPVVDAVEVVRCKDCRHWIKDEKICCGQTTIGEDESSIITGENDFCSMGERWLR